MVIKVRHQQAARKFLQKTLQRKREEENETKILYKDTIYIYINNKK